MIELIVTSTATTSVLTVYKSGQAVEISVDILRSHHNRGVLYRIMLHIAERIPGFSTEEMWQLHDWCVAYFGARTLAAKLPVEQKPNWLREGF